MKKKRRRTERQLSADYFTNNRGARGILTKSGIKPEEIPAEKEIKKNKDDAEIRNHRAWQKSR